MAFRDFLALLRRMRRQTCDAFDMADDHFGEFRRDVQDDEDRDLLDRRDETFEDDRQGLRSAGRGADDDDARPRLSQTANAEIRRRCQADAEHGLPVRYRERFDYKLVRFEYRASA